MMKKLIYITGFIILVITWIQAIFFTKMPEVFEWGYLYQMSFVILLGIFLYVKLDDVFQEKAE